MHQLPEVVIPSFTDESLYIEILGEGPETVVFVPGLGGTTRYWAARVASLASRQRVVLVDLLGFGRSPKPWTQYSVERHTSALHDAIAHLGPVTLVGHSLGALISVAYAARNPDAVRSIVALGMPNFGSQRRAYRYFREGPVGWGYVYTNVALTMIACILTRRVFGWLLPFVVRSVPREVAEDLVKHTWRSSTSSLWEVVYRYDVAEDLKNLPSDIDVAFVHGDEDLMAPLSVIRTLLVDHPNWHCSVLPGVDHHPFLREPVMCTDLIEKQLVQRSTSK